MTASRSLVVCLVAALLLPVAQGAEREATRDESVGPIDSMQLRIVSRFLPAGPAPEGVTASAAPTAEQRLEDAAEAIVEEAEYRLAISAAERSLRPSGIEDNDWVRVRSTTPTPYRAVCHIETTWPALDGQGRPLVTDGTAFFVSPRVLVTGARNVRLRDLGGTATKVRVYPGRSGASKPFGHDVSRSVFWLGSWDTSNQRRDADSDIAWIVLPDRTLYRRIRYAFPVEALSEEALERADLTSLSYPDPAARGKKMYEDFETRSQILWTNYSFRHFHDWLPGSGGAPMFRTTSNGRQIVVGILSGPSDEGSGNSFASRLTTDRVDAVEWLIENNP